MVDIWEKGTTRDPYIMALVRLLYFRAAQYTVYAEKLASQIFGESIENRCWHHFNLAKGYSC